MRTSAVSTTINREQVLSCVKLRILVGMRKDYDPLLQSPLNLVDEPGRTRNSANDGKHESPWNEGGPWHLPVTAPLTNYVSLLESESRSSPRLRLSHQSNLDPATG